jgi:hypothetical protein
MEARFLHSQGLGELFLPQGYKLANVLVAYMHREMIDENGKWTESQVPSAAGPCALGKNMVCPCALLYTFVMNYG